MSEGNRQEIACGTKRKREATVTKKRTSLACDTCRKQKEKCEGGQPCWRCQRLDRQCQFSTPQATRRPSHSPREDLSLCHSPKQSNRHQKNLEQIVQHFLGDVDLNEENIARVAATCEAKSKEVENSLDVAEEPFDVHFVSKDVAFYSGEFSHWNFSEKLRRTMRSRRDSTDLNVKEYWRPTHLQSSIHIVAESITHLPPRPIAEFLSIMFFKYTEVNSFYAERPWVQEKLDLCYNPNTIFTASDIPWVCTIFAILAVGTQMAHMEEDRAGSDFNVPEDIFACSEDAIGLGFYRIACKLVPDVIIAASYESVQAFLILAVFALPVSTGGLSYTYFGLAMKMAIQNGMHRKYTGDDFNRKTIELRNRLFWSVYSLERRTSIMHGRPNSLARCEVNADLPTNSPEFDSPNFGNMIAFIDLVSWTAEVSETLVQFKRCPKRLLSEYSERLMHLKIKTRQWWESLPINHDCRDLTPQGPLFRHNCHLKLCYLGIYVYMGRPFIFNPRNRYLEEERNDNESQQSELVKDCVQSAFEILATLQSLADNFGLCRASYTEFSSCRAALLVILAESLNSGMSSALHGGLNRGMVLIRQMTGGTSSQSEISYIESMEMAIRQLLSNNESDEHGSNTAQRSTSAYAKFKDWTQSMKRDNCFGNTTELSSFSPVSCLNSGAGSAFNPDINDWNNLLNSDWTASELNLDPEAFLDPGT